MGNVFRFIASGSLLVIGFPTFAAEDTNRFAWHLQATYVEQHVGPFHAPYSGANSLTPNQSRQTADVTLYAGARLWPGAELWINPELDQGFGLNDTTGLAGFSSGEAYKVGRSNPYLRWQRAFVRETWNVGGEYSTVEAAANQFSNATAADRLVLTLGKFGVGDVFDVNRYAHDPRSDFLNWSLIDTGSFDYAADAWGYTEGAALEWYQGGWSLRGGFFDVSDVPNSPQLEPGFDEYQWIAELERRFTVGGRPGKLAATAFSTHARMALLTDAIAWGVTHSSAPDPTAVRQQRERSGASLNLEQEIYDGAGVFARAGTSNGAVETYDFTDIDRSLAAGLTLGAKHWADARDTVGLAWVVNGISRQRRQYLAAGGMGVLVGDGQLTHAGNEQIAEAYYNLSVFDPVHLTLDFQRVRNPAYNRDRGPADIVALRFHVQI
ncbi:MAG TPA: carbohydrate porin [Steroidobacteraceae bacterium]|nr:carbohydrate porin [Steroidobacteraceae bacterium]